MPEPKFMYPFLAFKFSLGSKKYSNSIPSVQIKNQPKMPKPNEYLRILKSYFSVGFVQKAETHKYTIKMAKDAIKPLTPFAEAFKAAGINQSPYKTRKY